MPFDRGHAVLIGVGTYQNTPGLNVPITADDARAVAQVLRDPRFCGYPESQVALLNDERATSAGILAAFDQLASRVGLDDTVVLFYCGHGDFGEDGEYYLTSHETRIADKKVVAGTGLSQKTLLENLRAIRAQRMLLIFNACHSGAVAPTLGAEEPPAGQNPPDETAAALLATGAGRIIITACRAAQLSYVGTGKLTLFTQALVSGLLGQGVAGRNGYISAFDLYTHIFDTVGRQVLQQFGTRQEPELTILKGVGPFAVALYRGATTLGAFDERAAPAPDAAVRPVDEQASRDAFERIMSVGQGVAVGRDVRDSTVIGRDQVNAQDSSGAITGQVSGSVSQNFGSQQTVNTGGGDYAGGNIDKRQGQVFIEGGVVGGLSTGESTAPQELQRRRFEAATPETAQIGRSTEVRVMIALEHSSGLRSTLPDFTPSGQLLNRKDVVDHNVRVAFSQGVGSIDIYLMLEGPDFIIPQPAQSLRVPRDDDSGIATFTLTPNRVNELSRVVIRLYQDAYFSRLIDSLTLNVIIRPEGFNLEKAVWRLFGSSWGINWPSSALAAAGSQATIITNYSPTYNIDQRQGQNFIEGGIQSSISDVTTPGTLTGINFGSILNTTVRPVPGGTNLQPSLDQILAQARQAAEAAGSRGDDDLADDLQAVVLALEAAQKAEQAGRAERRSAKLAEARVSLERLATSHPELGDLAAMLGRI